MKWMKGLLLTLLLLAGCANRGSNETVQKDQEPLMILAPSGAPALALLPLYGNYDIETVQGSDVITAELAGTDSMYDVIVAPINTGTKLLAEGKSSYALNAVLTWGNLYLVGTNPDALQESGVLAAFGEAAVPGMILKNTIDPDTLPLQVTYYNAVNEVQAALLAQKANVGLMAEPAASATIAKGKENGIDLQIIADLQTMYLETHEMTNPYGYPQAALFIKEGREEACKELIEQLDTFSNQSAKDRQTLKKMLEEADMEMIGMPNASIALATWERQNIHYVPAKDLKEDLSSFLALFQVTYSEDMLSRQ